MFRTYMDGCGWFYHSNKLWTLRTHIGRVAETSQGRYAVYSRDGKHLGTTKTLKGATTLLKIG